MAESDLYAPILSTLSRGPTRLFRQQSMLAWAGKILSRTASTITLIHPQAVKLGTPGIADLGGLTSVAITPEMIGSTIAQYLAIELKFGRGQPTEEQAAFIAMVRSLGGRAGIARSVEDARLIISGDPNA